MDILRLGRTFAGGYNPAVQPMDIQSSPMVQEYPHRPPIDPDSMTPSLVITAHDVSAQSPGSKLGKFGSLGFKKTTKWGLGGMFGMQIKTIHCHLLMRCQSLHHLARRLH